MFGDYFGIRRDYSVEEFKNDVKPQGVTKSVHVTAMWGPDRALDETRWLQSVADKHGFTRLRMQRGSLRSWGRRSVKGTKTIS